MRQAPMLSDISNIKKTFNIFFDASVTEQTSNSVYHFIHGAQETPPHHSTNVSYCYKTPPRHLRDVN